MKRKRRTLADIKPLLAREIERWEYAAAYWAKVEARELELEIDGVVLHKANARREIYEECAGKLRALLDLDPPTAKPEDKP